MTNITNISAINLSKPIVEKRFFNNFFDKPISFASNQHDALLSFFQTVAKNPKAAMILTSAVIYTGKQQGIEPMQILEKFRSLNGAELSRVLTLFLNYYRYGSSLIGTSIVKQNNKYVMRSVVY